jgi:hypothetical protein
VGRHSALRWRRGGGIVRHSDVMLAAWWRHCGIIMASLWHFSCVMVRYMCRGVVMVASWWRRGGVMVAALFLDHFV